MFTFTAPGSRNPGADRDLVPLAFAMGMAGGLVEGVGHMLLQALNFLDNSWYQIIWIAAFFNAALVAAGALVLTVISWRFAPRDRVRGLVVFLITVAACVPWTALILKQWMEGYAILVLTLGIGIAFARLFLGRQATVVRRARASIPWLVGISVLAFVVIDGGEAWRERRGTANLAPASAGAPDVLVVIVDTLRADHLSSYGYRRATSPAIDRLAAEGVLFEQAYSASSYTLLSHVSILSGLYGNQHGIEWHNSHDSHNAAYPVLPAVMQRNGYRTAAFSGNTFYFAREHGFGRGFLHFDDYFSSYADMAFRTAFGGIATHGLRRVGFEDHPARKRAADTNRAVLKWIERNDEHPFFVVINYIDAHDPYLPPQPFRDKFATRPNPGGLINAEIHGRRVVNAEEMASEVEAYDGAIAYVDNQIDALLASLRSRSSSRDLLVIVTSDHGEEFGEHGAVMHGRHLYREVIHVPLIVWRPGQVPAGRRVAAPVSNATIPATVMGLLGLDGSMFGVGSVQPLWEGAATTASSAPRSDLKQRPWAEEGSQVRIGSLRSVVTPGYHYIHNDGAGEELFERASDPGEVANLADKEPFKAEVERHRDLMK